MTSAALALALAMLISPAPARLRCHTLVGHPRAAGARARIAAHDPLAVASTLDALAACLTAGMPIPTAARAVAESAPPELAMVLRRAADLLALGADPAMAWSVHPADKDARPDEQTMALLRLARRSASSGVALAAGVAKLAMQSRQELSHRAEATAERAAVVIAGPLGVCFLPAFLCLGVVPVVAGLATKVLGSGLL